LPSQRLPLASIRSVNEVSMTLIPSVQFGLFRYTSSFFNNLSSKKMGDWLFRSTRFEVSIKIECQEINQSKDIKHK